MGTGFFVSAFVHGLNVTFHLQAQLWFNFEYYYSRMATEMGALKYIQCENIHVHVVIIYTKPKNLLLSPHLRLFSHSKLFPQNHSNHLCQIPKILTLHSSFFS